MMVNIYPLFHFWRSPPVCSFVINRPWIKDRFMSPDIEAVHRLLLDQKASPTTVNVQAGPLVIRLNGNKFELYVYIFHSGVECGQTLHWQVSVGVHPRVPSRLPHCLLPGLSSIAEEACPTWVNACPILFIIILQLEISMKTNQSTWFNIDLKMQYWFSPCWLSSYFDFWHLSFQYVAKTRYVAKIRNG